MLLVKCWLEANRLSPAADGPGLGWGLPPSGAVVIRSCCRKTWHRVETILASRGRLGCRRVWLPCVVKEGFADARDRKAQNRMCRVRCFYGKYVVEPLERGYGTTLGELAGVGCCCHPCLGAAVVSVRIDGVLHEFSNVEGVVEDTTDIVLNLKSWWSSSIQTTQSL